MALDLKSGMFLNIFTIIPQIFFQNNIFDQIALHTNNMMMMRPSRKFIAGCSIAELDFMNDILFFQKQQFPIYSRFI